MHNTGSIIAYYLVCDGAGLYMICAGMYISAGKSSLLIGKVVIVAYLRGPR